MKPTERELDRIKQHAHGAWGYDFDHSMVMDIWNLCHSLTPVLRRRWPPASIVRRIARSHLECWEAYNR